MLKQLEIEIVELGEDDVEDIAMLINEMHPTPQKQLFLRSRSKEYYHWMYFQNPAGRAHIFGARHNGKLVSSFALAPKLFEIGGIEYLCGKTMDMFTHPEYQGMGLMKVLAARVFESAKKSGISMWYVTPSKKSYPIFLKKWKCVESFELNYTIKILSYRQLLEKYIKPQIVGRVIGRIAGAAEFFKRLPLDEFQNYEITPINDFNNDIEILWQSFRKNYRVIQVRNSIYLNWRYVANPDSYQIFQFKQNGHIGGVIVLKFTTRNSLKIGEIVDYLYLKGDRQIFQTMISWAIKQLRRDKCAVIQSWTIDASLTEREIFNVGLKKKRKKLKMLLSPNVSLTLFYNKEAWFITEGDGNDI